MCAGLRVTAQPSDLGEVEPELVLEPVDRIAGAAGQHSDEVVACEFAGLDSSDVSASRGGECDERQTDSLVSSKKSFALSGIPASCCVCVPAPLIPDVALVELPPMNLHWGGSATTLRIHVSSH